VQSAWDLRTLPAQIKKYTVRVAVRWWNRHLSSTSGKSYLSLDWTNRTTNHDYQSWIKCLQLS
jgi:hypothetical protein